MRPSLSIFLSTTVSLLLVILLWLVKKNFAVQKKEAHYRERERGTWGRSGPKVLGAQLGVGKNGRNLRKEI